MNTEGNGYYTLTVIAESCVSPLTGKVLPELREELKVYAPSVHSARTLVPVFMTIKPQGQLLRVFWDGIELFGNH